MSEHLVEATRRIQRRKWEGEAEEQHPHYWPVGLVDVGCPVDLHLPQAEMRVRKHRNLLGQEEETQSGEGVSLDLRLRSWEVAGQRGGD